MKAVRLNKEYTISDKEKARYAAEGYDIVDDEGKVIEYGKGKTVPYEKYKKVLDELNALKSGVDLTTMTVDELTSYAKAKGIDIGQATSQEGILKKIKAAQEV